MKNNFLGNFAFVLLSNGIGLVLSIAINIVLPIVFKDSIAEYGYVQLYLLYVSYYYLFDLGLCNGIYLREGGNDYNSLNKARYAAQLRLLMFSQLCVAAIITGISLFLIHDTDRKFVFIMVAINIIFMQTKTYYTAILQATNRIKEYSLSIITCKLFNAVAILLLLLSEHISNKVVILILTAGELISLFYLIFQCRDMTFRKATKIRLIRDEAIDNIKSGASLLISGVSSMFMLGFTRLAIENQWGIETFAKISFTISLTNMFMLFINAVSVVLYPQMKRMPEGRYVDLYGKMRNLLMPLLFISIVLYYPARLVLETVLPQYHDGLMYMAILLPICLYTSKMNLLIQTYMKALRMEKQLMTTNIISFIVAAILTIITVYWFDNLLFTVFGVVISQAFRAIIAEVILSRKLRVNIYTDIILEIVLSVVFIVANWYISGWVGLLLYMATVCVYLLVKAKSINGSIRYVFKR